MELPPGVSSVSERLGERERERERERGPFKLPRTPNLLVLLLQWRLGTRTEIVFLNLFL